MLKHRRGNDHDNFHREDNLKIPVSNIVIRIISVLFNKVLRNVLSLII